MIEQPKKERRFLKTLERVGEILIQEVLIKIGSNLIKKIGGKKTLPSILFLLASLSLFAQYPATGNKQRLGYQTTGDGLLFRGRASDTTALKPSTINNAYFVLDTVNNVLYNYIITKGGWQFSNGDTIIINNNFTQPFDSLFFKTSVPTNNVDTAKMRWDSDLGTVVLGMYDKVPNELGFKNFWLVKNQTGSTITKGSIVYANGTVGASGRITIAKFIANGTIDAKYLLGITAHDLGNGEDGYVISFGKIRQVNTDTFAAGSILYPSPNTAGVWTDVEPVAPNIIMPIGFCINSSSNNGTIAIRVASGYKLSELHDVAILSPVENSSLYYKSGLWRDTTAALLVSDTALMLTPYLRKLDTVSLSNRINLKLNISDTASMLTPYFKDADTTSLNLTSRFATKLNISDTASMLTPYFRDSDTTSLNLTSRFATKLNISDTASMLSNYLRSGVAASTYQAKLNGIGLVYANGTNISYDNSTYLTTSSAASTYQIILTNPVTGTGTNDFIPKFTSTGSTIGNSIIQESSGNIGIGITPTSNLELAKGKFIMLNSRDNVSQDSSGIMLYETSTKTATDINFGAKIMYDAISDNFEIKMKNYNGTTLFNPPVSISIPRTTGIVNIGTSLAVTGNITEGGNNVLTNLDTASLSSRIDSKFNSSGGTISGAVTLSTTTAVPTVLLGKDGSNVVGELNIGGGLVTVGSNLISIKPFYAADNVTSIIYASGFMNTVSTVYQKITQNSTVTITLPSAVGYAGRSFVVKNLGTGAVISNASNVEPFNSSSLGPNILPSGGGKWARLVSDGTNWVIMEAN